MYTHQYSCVYNKDMDNTNTAPATVANGYVRVTWTHTELSREVFDHGVRDAKGRAVGSIMVTSSTYSSIDPDGSAELSSSDVTKLGMTVEGKTIYSVHTVATRDGECFGGGRPGARVGLEFTTHGEARKAGAAKISAAKARAVKKFG